eukprot:1874531-Prymnesium_polylepis.3
MSHVDRQAPGRSDRAACALGVMEMKKIAYEAALVALTSMVMLAALAAAGGRARCRRGLPHRSIHRLPASRISPNGTSHATAMTTGVTVPRTGS